MFTKVQKVIIIVNMCVGGGDMGFKYLQGASSMVLI